MFSYQIIPLFRIAVQHHELHTVAYLLGRQLYPNFDCPDIRVAKDALTIAEVLQEAIKKDPATFKEFVADVDRIIDYARKTVDYVNKH